MRYSAQKYAQALFEILEEAPEEHHDSIIRRFVSFLDTTESGMRWHDVIRAFEQYYDARRGVETAVITVADKADGDALRETIVGAEVVVRRDPDVIGGARIRMGDMQIDNTVRTRLRRLRKALEG